ncbi:hypothetical protein DIURU_000430 [Diutina rugosa]|uniref:Uncharacterized protein n=1 Tax=Diutina rugosa TaxID=5481 RepID=A0A642UXQ0_DIURU|nr:uncharacterized protein DIURU_000430 [Diutina rugosa]KAA8907743.1 hypothetical protein DIURU_000430 [Diutina rugosa]
MTDIPRPPTKQRFGWVKRLVQGQGRQGPSASVAKPQAGSGLSHSYVVTSAGQTSDEDATSLASSERSVRSHSEIHTIQSDNVSTIPLKSVISVQSTKSPSILSDPHGATDQSSFNPSTTETSIAASSIGISSPQTTVHTGVTERVAGHNLREDRDAESVVTLASSTRRRRRRSIDTNCSTAGIPPASIMERLTVHPGGGALSNYARSIEDQKSERSGRSGRDEIETH